MRVMVMGGRHFTETTFVAGILDRIHQRYPVTTLVLTDAATGVAAIARIWAVENEVPVESFLIDWKTYGKTAGRICCRQMLSSEPDLVVIYPGGELTTFCRDLARKASLPLFQPVHWKKTPG